MKKSCRAPIMDALLIYNEKGQVSLHVPGHKDGAAYREKAQLPTAYEDAYRRFGELLRYDVTEVEGTDDLHQPEEAIKEAQELAAACFGSEETHFLIGGSTVGNIASVLACCMKQGDMIIVQRNVHKSVLNGLRMAGARAVFVSSREEESTGLISGPSVDVIQEALDHYPEARAILVCNPNYYGMGIELKPLAELAHQYGVPLIVDEAHGAHYGFHPMLPQSALQAGADLVIQSTHKMLASMTMSAMLHVQGNLVQRERLKKVLTMIQSSSPSYPLLASLDLSRLWIEEAGSALFEEGLKAVNQIREALYYRPLWGVVAKDTVTETGSYNSGYTWDPFKLVIWDRTGHWSGYQLLEQLQRAGCVAEMADLKYVVLILTLADTRREAEKVLQALKQLESIHPHSWTDSKDRDSEEALLACEDMLQSNEMDFSAIHNQSVFSRLKITAPIAFSLYEDERSVMTLPIDEVAGYEAAEPVVPYPPGIPLIIQGETLTERHIALLKQLADAGAKCQEVMDSSLRTLRVYEKNN